MAVAVGPVGRCVEADLNMGLEGGLGGIYTYSLSKGLYAGASFDGKLPASLLISTLSHVCISKFTSPTGRVYCGRYPI